MDKKSTFTVKQYLPHKLEDQEMSSGLAKALGLNLKRDAFSEANMKSREYVC
jgi:hypothetical protein